MAVWMPPARSGPWSSGYQRGTHRDPVRGHVPAESQFADPATAGSLDSSRRRQRPGARPGSGRRVHPPHGDYWGTGVGISNLAPSRARDPAAREYWARLQSRAASPAAAAKFLRALTDIDVRHALTTISLPTLIVHATRDQNVPIAAARELRDEIEGGATRRTRFGRPPHLAIRRHQGSHPPYC